MENIVEEYINTHPRSRKLHERALNLFPANGATHIARVLDPYRPYITHAKGSRKWDVDGNEYIDYVMGHGGLILGHSHPAIVLAVQEQVAKGIHYGENHELEIEWAELINKMMPMAERVEFCASGQEANMMGIRLSRIFTGRKKVLRLEENYHGWADELVNESLPGVITPDVKTISFNDLNKVEEELAKKEYAILMVEGGGAHMNGQVPIDIDYVRALPELTRKYGTVWLLDEVVTGFRDAPGGWQSLVGVQPDLCTVGKCVSGGLPAGVLIGRADIFSALDPRTSSNRQVRHGGTWNANPLVCSAGIAACKLYLTGEPQRKARENADYLRRKGNDILKEKHINGRLYSRSIVHFYLGPLEYEPSDETMPPTNNIDYILNPSMIAVRTRLSLHLLQRGIATMGGRFFILSAAHTEEDIKQTIDAFSTSLDAMILEKSLESV